MGEPRWHGTAWFAAIYLLGVGGLLVRLGLGLLGIRSLLKKAQRIDDAGLACLVKSLRDEMQITGEIRAYESAELSTPATVGWRHPALLMPENWREWDQAEKRAIVAHELAHVRRGDYAVGVWAQVCLAVNWVHPLAHWMAGRFRLEQELVADAWGAKLSGGNRPYLYTLARLALGQNRYATAWPSRAFLPSRGTLTRRIEMLRDSKPVDVLSRRPRSLFFSFAALTAASLALAGVRVPRAEATAPVQEPKAPAKGGAIDLGMVPSGTGLMVALRPSDIVGKPGFEALAEFIGPQRGNHQADRHPGGPG